MPLPGACGRLWTNSRSSSRRSAGYRVPSLRSKKPFDLSRSSWRIWNPYCSSFERRARRQSWIEPFFSSAVHSGETSGVGLASYPGLGISVFGRRPLVRCRRGFGHDAGALERTRSSVVKWKEKGGRGDAYFWRLALDRRYRAGPMAIPTTANCAARIVNGVRLTPDGRVTNDSVEISGSWLIT